MKAKVLRDYKRKQKNVLGEVAQHVHDSLPSGTGWPTTTVTEADFQSDINAYNDAVLHTDGGSKADTAAMKAARVTVLWDMDGLADWVDKQANGDPAVILSYGFNPTATTRGKVVLTAPVIKAVINYAATKLKLQLNPVAGAHGYEVQVCAPNGNWVLAGSFPSTRDLVVSGLVSGTNYQIRVRAVAGAGNYGEWSDVATHVCT